MKLLKSVSLMIALLMLTGCQSRDRQYGSAVNSMANGEFEEAYSVFETMEGYKDSDSYAQYCSAVIDANNGNFDSAATTLKTLAEKNFLDSAVRYKYYSARAIEAAGDGSRYEEAATLYAQCKGWEDSAERRDALIGMTESADTDIFSDMPVAEDTAATPAPPKNGDFSGNRLSPTSK